MDALNMCGWMDELSRGGGLVGCVNRSGWMDTLNSGGSMDALSKGG